MLVRMAGDEMEAAMNVNGTATCMFIAAMQLPTAAAINSALYCGFPQVLTASFAELARGPAAAAPRPNVGLTDSASPG